MMTYETHKDENGRWQWRLVTVEGSTLAHSGEAYASERDCLAAINLVKGSWFAPIDRRETNPTPPVAGGLPRRGASASSLSA